MKLPNFPLPMVSLMNPPLHGGSHTPSEKGINHFCCQCPVETNDTQVWCGRSLLSRRSLCPWYKKWQHPLARCTGKGNFQPPNGVQYFRHQLLSPPGWSKTSGHIIFYLIITWERKAWWVKDVHRTLEPENSTYAGVVSQEIVRTTLTYAALNALDVCTCDIKMPTLKAPVLRNTS